MLDRPNDTSIDATLHDTDLDTQAPAETWFSLRPPGPTADEILTELLKEITDGLDRLAAAGKDRPPTADEDPLPALPQVDTGGLSEVLCPGPGGLPQPEVC